MKHELQNRHYSDKGSHAKRGEHFRNVKKAFRQEARLRRKGEQPTPIFSKLVGSDIIFEYMR
jgi:hypothetical protein